MTILANVQEGSGSVSVRTDAAQDGGYQTAIHVTHGSPDGDFERTYHHARTFDSEREAVFERLREGMTWLVLKTTPIVDRLSVG